MLCTVVLKKDSIPVWTAAHETWAILD